MGLGAQYLPDIVLFAMAGGVGGALIASRTDGDRWQRTVWETLAAGIASAALAENYLPANKVWLCCLTGLIVGLVSGYALDAVREMAPAAVREFLGGIARRLTGKMPHTTKEEDK